MSVRNISDDDVEVLRRDFWRGDSLAGGPGPVSCRGAGQTFALGLGRLSFGLRGAGVAHQLTEELKLGQEELPDDVPTEQHEEQRTHQSGHDDQQCEPDALPHLSRTAAPAHGGEDSLFSAQDHADTPLAQLVTGPGRHIQTAAHRTLTPACLLS